MTENQISAVKSPRHAQGLSRAALCGCLLLAGAEAPPKVGMQAPALKLSRALGEKHEAGGQNADH